MQRGNVSIRRAFTLMVAAINAGGMSSTGTRGRGPLDRPTRSHRRPRALAPWCAINGRPSRNGKLRRNQWPVVAREPVGNGCVVPQEIVDQSKWTPPQRRFSLSLSLSLSLFSVAAIPRLLIFLIFPPSFSCAPIAVYFSISVSRLFLHFCLFFIWLQCFICLSKARKKCPSAQYRLTEAAKITKTFFSFHISSPFFLFSPSTFVFVRFLFWLSLWLPEKGK